MRCLHHPFVLVSWFRGFVRRRPSIVFVVVFIEVVGFWCGGARVSSSSGLLLLLFRVSRDDPDRDGLDDGFLRRRRRCLHPRLRVRFGRKALRRHRSRIEKERKKKKRFLGVVRTDMVRSLYASHSRKDDTITREKGKKKGKKMCLDIPCATRQDTRALARCTRPRCRTPQRFDRAQPRSTFFSSSSFHNRLLLLERSTTLLVRVIKECVGFVSRSSFPSCKKTQRDEKKNAPLF